MFTGTLPINIKIGHTKLVTDLRSEKKLYSARIDIYFTISIAHLVHMFNAGAYYLHVRLRKR